MYTKLHAQTIVCDFNTLWDQSFRTPDFQKFVTSQKNMLIRYVCVIPPGQKSQEYQPEELNKRGVAITQRVKQKLTGKDLMYQLTGSRW